MANLAGRKNPEASLECYLNMDEERKRLDKMQEVAAKLQKQPSSFEHDGIVGVDWGGWLIGSRSSVYT